MTYPTQTSIDAAEDAHGPDTDDLRMRSALLAADEHNPIMQTAVEVAKDWAEGSRDLALLDKLLDAVVNAGKL